MLRDQILNATDTQIEIVEVPEWGDVKVGVRSMSLGEQQEFLDAVRTRTGQKQDTFRVDRAKFGPQLLIRTLVDPETEKPIFQPADAAAIAAKSAKAAARLVSVASRLAGLSDDEESAIAELKPIPDDV